MAVRKVIGDWVSTLWDRIGAPAGVSISADVAAVKTDSGNLITRLGTPAAGTVAGDVESVETKVDTENTRSARVCLFKDQWCATPIASQAITAAAADLSFSDVVLPTGFLPSGAVVQAVYLLFKWRKQVDSSGAANAINGASKTIRVKKSTGAWGTDDVVGITVADNQLATALNATEGGDMIVGDADISSEVDDLDNVTYNVRSEQTNRTDALVVDAASLTLYDIYSGLRCYFTLS